MARRRYYRRSYRVVAPKKKWATNMKSGLMSKTIAGTQDEMNNVLVLNSVQSATPTPIVVKTGNFKIQGDCNLNATGGNIGVGTSVTLYVMYIPEAVFAGGSLITVVEDHPEWIMAWKVVDLNVGSAAGNGNSFSFSSRLKRNLNSGDGIALVAVLKTSSSSSILVTINYTAQYWTCAN